MLIELFLLAVVVAAVVLAIRGGKSAGPEAPLVIDRDGKFHLTLAPQLATAQTLIERISDRFFLSGANQTDLPTQYWVIRDPQIAGDCYLLAVALRHGKLYFQGIRPLLREDHLKTIREYSQAVLAGLPFAGQADAAGLEGVRAAVDTAAVESGVTAIRLDESDRSANG